MSTAVRELLERANHALLAGSDEWRALHAEAAAVAAGIRDATEADDAATRVAMFDHQAALLDGDQTAALAALDRGLAAVGRQRQRGLEGRRLNEHEWGLRLARVQTLINAEQLRAAAPELDALERLAALTLRPAHTQLRTLLTRAAFDFQRQRYPQARDRYARAVADARTQGSAADLPVALIGLAQAQLLCAEYDACATTITQAAAFPLDISAQANLAQLRALLASQQQAANEAELVAEQIDLITRHRGQLDPAYRQQAQQQGAHLEHLAEHVILARERYRQQADAARRAGDAPGERAALLALARATQDAAFMLPNPRLHVEALRHVDRARQLAQQAQQQFVLVACDLLEAKFLRQWHTEVTELNRPVLERAAALASSAAVAYHRFGYEAALPGVRREFLAHYRGEALALAMETLFALGDATALAECIEWSAASAHFTQGDDGVAVAAAAPLWFAPGWLVLADAHNDGQVRCHLPVDARQPIPTW